MLLSLTEYAYQVRKPQRVVTVKLIIATQQTSYIFSFYLTRHSQREDSIINEERHFKGIIFDFNGTLLLDSPFHEQAWVTISKGLRTPPLTAEEFRLTGHGRTNKEIITTLIGREPHSSEIESIAEDKESLYRKMCLQHPDIFQLASGVRPFLDTLLDTNIPFTIATGSAAVNLDFYFQHLDLGRWFDRSRIVYDDGSYPGKPAPDVFHLAAAKLSLKTADCLVFEDSYMGIQAACSAGAAKVIAVEKSLDPEKLKASLNKIIFCDGFSEMSLNYLNKII